MTSPPGQPQGGKAPSGPLALRILHIWNTAGVADVIAKFTDRAFGTSSFVAMRKEFDPYGLTTRGKDYDDGALTFSARVAFMSRSYDIIHVHSFDRILPWLRRFNGRKPIVLLYHGGDILGRWEERRKYWKKADFLAYSTPDLGDGAPQGAHLMYNPVDTDIFFPRPVPRDQTSAVSRHYGMDVEAAAVAKKMGLTLSWLGREETSRLPALLSSSAYFIDLRKRKGDSHEIRCLGKLALEALACGTKAVRWDGAVVQGLPPEHVPGTVASRWFEVYSGLAGRSGT